MIEFVNAVYAFIDQMHLTITGLLVAVAILSLAFIFAVREAASWFFKIDDIKKDVRRVQNLILELEGEVKVMQELVSQAKRLNQTEETTIDEQARLVRVRPHRGADQLPAVPSEKPASFPINH